MITNNMNQNLYNTRLDVIVWFYCRYMSVTNIWTIQRIYFQ